MVARSCLLPGNKARTAPLQTQGSPPGQDRELEQPRHREGLDPANRVQMQMSLPRCRVVTPQPCALDPVLAALVCMGPVGSRRWLCLQGPVSSSRRVEGRRGGRQRAAQTTVSELQCLETPKRGRGFLPSCPALGSLLKQEGRLAGLCDTGTGARQGQTSDCLALWCESTF